MTDYGLEQIQREMLRVADLDGETKAAAHEEAVAYGDEPQRALPAYERALAYAESEHTLRRLAEALDVALGWQDGRRGDREPLPAEGAAVPVQVGGSELGVGTLSWFSDHWCLQMTLDASDQDTESTLTEALRELGREYGPVGVLLAAAELVGVETAVAQLLAADATSKPPKGEEETTCPECGKPSPGHRMSCSHAFGPVPVPLFDHWRHAPEGRDL